MDSFIFYKSFTDALRGIEAEQFKTVVIAVSDYATDGITPEGLDPICNALFTLIKPQVEANIRKREAGRKGGEANAKQIEAKAKQNEAEQKQTEANVNVNDNVNVNIKEKVKEKESPAVAVATLDCPDEVKARLQGMIDARKQVKKPMTANAVRLMYKHLCELSSDPGTQCQLLDQSIRNGWLDVYPLKTDSKRASPNKFNSMMQHDYDFTELEKVLTG